MKTIIIFLIFVLSYCQAGKIVEEIILKEGNQKDQRKEIVLEKDRQERRYEEILIISEEKSNKGLVPQLWPNYTGPIEPDPETVSCNVARMKCAYRAGCGLALQNYALGCLDLVNGKSKICNQHCKNSLIALMSTHEGRRLMKCNCSDDSFCQQSKANIEACQGEVMYATREDTIVSCTAAQWICSADPLCSTALEYYNRFCHAMFKGKKCSARCMNSISILKRQPMASKLETCYCEGNEDFDCIGIKSNMERLCFKIDNEIEPSPSQSGSSWSAKFEKLFVFITIFVGIFVNWVGASFQIMMENLQIQQEPSAPPEEIGVQ